jgi:uncharacterized membrane protein
MKKKSTTKALVILAALSPLIYLLISWPSIPDSFTTRFEFDDSFEKIQSRSSLLFNSIALTSVSVILYLCMRNLKRFDPKVKESTPTSTFHKLGLIITLFLTVINYFLILSAKYGWVIDTHIAVAFFGFLIVLLGNYMNNLKPNYIAGIRLPWTLNDPENWRKTHLLTGKIWFAGGLLLIVLSFIIPKHIVGFFVPGFMMVLIIIPGIYSYRLYKNKIN